MNGKLTQGGVWGGLVCLLVVAALWAGQGGQTHEPATPARGLRNDSHRDSSLSADDGNAWVRAAADQIRRGPPFEARVRQDFQLYGVHRSAYGSYFERGEGTGQLRWELKTTVDDQLASLLRVSDGRFVYSKITLPQQTQTSRIDLFSLQSTLQQVWEGRGEPSRAVSSDRDRVSSDPDSSDPIHPGNQADSNAPRLDDPRGQLPEFSLPAGFGGLGFLLARLARDFDFTPPRSETIDATPVVRLTGHWNHKALQKMHRLFTGQELSDVSGEPTWLPEHLPTRVELTLGVEGPLRLFPFRVRLLRSRQSPSLWGWGPDHVEYEELMRLEFQQVQFGVRLDDMLFRYEAGGEEIEYRTDEYLRALQRRFPAS